MGNKHLTNVTLYCGCWVSVPDDLGGHEEIDDYLEEHGWVTTRYVGSVEIATCKQCHRQHTLR